MKVSSLQHQLEPGLVGKGATHGYSPMMLEGSFLPWVIEQWSERLSMTLKHQNENNSQIAQLYFYDINSIPSKDNVV